MLPWLQHVDRILVSEPSISFSGRTLIFYGSSYKMYYASYLQVVFDLSPAKAGYITNIYNLVSCSWAIIISFAFKYTDSYKWGAVVAVPVQILMTGLLIKFREPGTHLAFPIMVEVFAAMAGAMLVQIEQVAIMAAVPHKNMAVGIAIGQTISVALWETIVPRKLAEYLPADKIHETEAIYATIEKQLSYAWSTPERQAIVRAYGDAQRLMLIAGTCALVPCFLWVYMLKNYRLSEHKERKGLMA
jgi:hypothetical protein